jgi:hypothetical protein
MENGKHQWCDICKRTTWFEWFSGLASDYYCSVCVEKLSKSKESKIMHYRNGREAKNGDKIIMLSINEGKLIAYGVLYDAQPGNDFCNGRIAPCNDITGACICDCLHIDDLAEMLKGKGLDKRPK